MRDFLRGLFYQYYRWQEKVGNKDVAPFFSFLSMHLVTFFILASILFWSLQFDMSSIPTLIYKYVFIGAMVIIVVIYYLMFLHNREYKKIMEEDTKYGTGFYRFWAITFPIFFFVLLNLGWILKMLQNRGDL